MSLFTAIIGVTNKGNKYYYTNCPCWNAFNCSLNSSLPGGKDEKYEKIQVYILKNGGTVNSLTNQTATSKENIEQYLKYIGELMHAPFEGLEDIQTSYALLGEYYNSFNHTGKSVDEKRYTKNLEGYLATFDMREPFNYSKEKRNLYMKHFGPLVRLSYENSFNPSLNAVFDLVESKPWFFKYFTFYELVFLSCYKNGLLGGGHAAWGNGYDLPSLKTFFDNISKTESLPSSMFDCFTRTRNEDKDRLLKQLFSTSSEESLLKKFNELNKFKK